MFSFLSKLQAFLMAAYIFIAGLAYGNEPIKVDFTAATEVTAENVCRVTAEVTNIGRPFKGTSKDSVSVRFYKIVDGEKVYTYDYDVMVTDDIAQDVLVKHGDVRTMGTNFYFRDTCEPGEYIVEVSVEHCDKVYTDTITLT